MAQPTPEELALARKIVECAVHWSPQTDRDLQSGKNDKTPEMKIALDAIRKVTSLAVKAAMKIEDHRTGVPCPDGIKGCLVYHFRKGGGPVETALRNNLHLKGDV